MADKRIQAALPNDFRVAVYYIDVQGSTYAETAAMLNIPHGTVMSRLARGRKRLRVAPAHVAANRVNLAVVERRIARPGPPCTPTAAAPPTENTNVRKERSMSKNNAGWEDAFTVLQEVRPPFIPESAEVKTVVADLPPGSAGFPPHRHSGPSFYYMLEGELQFELEGEPPRVIRAGEAFWEPGGDVTHYTNANNRDDIPCRFVVTLVSRSNSAMRELVPSRTSMAIAPSENNPIKKSAISKNYDGWQNALTVLQEARPPFIPESVHAMTVVVDYPPGSAGCPPHRHSGPAFGYMLEGEMLFELEGERPRVIRAGEAFWEPGGDVIHHSNANNRDDMRCRYTVTMLGAPGQPMLTLVDAEELEAREHLRAPAESNAPRSFVKE